MTEELMRTPPKNTVISSGVQQSREICSEIDLSITLRFNRDDDAFYRSLSIVAESKEAGKALKMPVRKFLHYVRSDYYDKYNGKTIRPSTPLFYSENA